MQVSSLGVKEPTYVTCACVYDGQVWMVVSGCLGGYANVAPEAACLFQVSVLRHVEKQMCTWLSTAPYL